MKKLFWLLVILIGGYWLYGLCTRTSSSDETKVLKQVEVAVKTANLRTGPGTNYDYATVHADGTGGRWQVPYGTVLDVMKEQKGWYRVRVGSDSREVYIKQSLCAAPGASKSGGRKGRTSSSSGEPSASSSSEPTPQAVAPVVEDPDNEVVEEVTSGAGDDVIF